MIRKSFLLVLLIAVSHFSKAQEANEKMESILAKKSHIIDSLKTVLEKKEEDVDVLKRIAEEYMSIDSDSLALTYANELFEIQKRTGDPNKIAEARLLKADIFFRLKKEEEAVQLLDKNIEDKNTINEVNLADTYSILSTYYSRIGKHEESLEHIQNNEHLYLKTNDSIGLVSVYSTIATTYFTINKKEKSIEYFEKASQYCTKGKEYNKIALLLNAAMLSSELQNFDNALKSAKEAEKIADEAQIFEIYPIMYKMIGLIYSQKREYRKSLDYCLRSLQLSKKSNSPQNHYNSLYNCLGTNYFFLEDYPNAIFYLEKAYELDPDNIRIQESKDPISENVLVKSYEKSGNYKKAYESIAKFSKIVDSSNSARRNLKLAEITEKYENEKKQWEIERLNDSIILQNEQLKRQNIITYSSIGFFLLLSVIGIILYKNEKNKSKLREAQSSFENLKLQQRFLRTQLNPHFLFHALSSIESYIYKGKKEQAAVFLQNFSKLMRNTLESSDMDFIPLKEDMAFIERYIELQRLNHEFKFDYAITVQEDIDASKVLIPPMLTQPFVENAIIHGALHSGSNVNISVIQETNHLIITINDDGQQQFEDSKASSKLNRSMSTDIVMERIQNLKNTHNIEIQYSLTNHSLESDAVTKGTTVTLSIPIIYGNFIKAV